MIDTKTKIAGAVLILVFFIALKKGVFSADKGRDIDPDKGAQDGSTPTKDQAYYINKAISIHESLSSYGQGLSGELYNIIQDLENLNDADLIEVANAYASKYPNDEYKTLYALISSTTTFYFSSTYTLKYELLDRLKKLGLG